jgi:hypothetical protein
MSGPLRHVPISHVYISSFEVYFAMAPVLVATLNGRIIGEHWMGKDVE